MTKKSLSVITVALNAAADLPLTIESVIHQSYPDIETILVDGMSWDSTQAVLDRYHGAFNRIEYIEDASIYSAMNAAALMASNEYILFLNAGDTLYSGDTIADMFARIDSDPDIFYGDHIYVDGRLEIIQRSSDFSCLRNDLRVGSIDYRWHSRIPGHQATFTRASLLKEMKYNPRYSICADHDLLLRAHDGGARMQYVDEIVAHYFAGGFSGAQGAKIHREWAHAYRSRSLRPTQVDKFIFGSASASPFDMYTSYSGYVISGAHGAELPPPDSGFDGFVRWAGIMEIAAPSDFVTLGLRMTGDNKLANQKLTLMSGGKVIARSDLGIGPFGLSFAFSEPLSAGATLTIIPDILAQLAPDDDRIAGIRLADFHFDIAMPLALSDLAAREDQLEQFASLLSGGWSTVELGGGFVWSVAKDAYLTANFIHSPCSISLYCSGNPHIPAGQELTVHLNDEWVGCYTLNPSMEPCEIPLAVGGRWRKGANVLRLSVNLLVQPPEDSRMLGFALSRLTWA